MRALLSGLRYQSSSLLFSASSLLPAATSSALPSALSAICGAVASCDRPFRPANPSYQKQFNLTMATIVAEPATKKAKAPYQHTREVCVLPGRLDRVRCGSR
jgi:hypothetical protein